MSYYEWDEIDKRLRGWCDCRECRTLLDEFARKMAIAWQCPEHGQQVATAVDIVSYLIVHGTDAQAAGR